MAYTSACFSHKSPEIFIPSICDSAILVGLAACISEAPRQCCQCCFSRSWRGHTEGAGGLGWAWPSLSDHTRTNLLVAGEVIFAKGEAICLQTCSEMEKRWGAWVASTWVWIPGSVVFILQGMGCFEGFKLLQANSFLSLLAAGLISAWAVPRVSMASCHSPVQAERDGSHAELLAQKGRKVCRARLLAVVRVTLHPPRPSQKEADFLVRVFGIINLTTQILI